MSIMFIMSQVRHDVTQFGILLHHYLRGIQTQNRTAIGNTGSNYRTGIAPEDYRCRGARGSKKVME